MIYDRLLSVLNARSFEHFIASVFEHQGYVAQVTGGANDQGVDIRLWKDGRQSIVQCKFTRGAIAPHVIRDLYGTLAHERADEAWLITLGWVTEQGRAWARGKPIHLVDGWRFLFWLASDSLEQADARLQQFARLQDGDVLRFVGAAITSTILAALFAAQRRRVPTFPVLALGGRLPLLSAIVALVGLTGTCIGLTGLAAWSGQGAVLVGLGGAGALFSALFFAVRAYQRRALINQVAQAVLARLDAWEYVVSLRKGSRQGHDAPT
ncbi:MAG: restriction endonuclease [Anaerolineae bacterium]|nr:restriction endonuclease [Anaerolineae bacterium]